MSNLAIDGGAPVRSAPLPYGRQTIDEEDIAAVTEALRSDFLTTGPRIESFERAFGEVVSAPFAVAVSNGTAALHCAMHALRIGPGDEVIVPTVTFVASANCVLYQGARPVLVDVQPQTLLIDPAEVERKITRHTKAIIAVDFAGQPCDYEALRAIAQQHGIGLVADACHATGAALDGRAVGTLADLSVFSFHPVKHVTSGEGGMITTADAEAAMRMRRFRHHGMSRPQGAPAWSYEVADLGNNYRLTDFQSALGEQQLRHLSKWVTRRQQIAETYDQALLARPELTVLEKRPGVHHAYHLYVVRLRPEALRVDRDQVLAALRAEGILATLHYPPVHLQPLYRNKVGTHLGQCPVAEEATRWIFSLPIFPTMTNADQGDVLTALDKVLAAYRR